MNPTEMYSEYSDFKDYVDKYCRTYGISKEEALSHELVRLYGEYCEEKIKCIPPN